MENILEKLKAGVRNTKIVKWPGTDIDVQMRIPNENDHHQASLTADRTYKSADIKVGVENIDNYEAEKTNQTLYRILSLPETNEPLAPTITEFRQLLTKDIRDILVEELNAFEQECSPNPNTMSDEEFDALYLNIKKNAPQTISNVTNIFCARKLITTLAAELMSLQTGNGSS